jgi:uncharacterized membrane protein YgcG
MRSMMMVGFMALAMVGCAGQISGQPGDVTFSLTGVSADTTTQLFDANYQSYCKQNKDWNVVSAIVTVNEIDAKINGSWVAIEQAPEQVDLLKLDNKALSTIGVTTIPAGKVTELRMVLDQLTDYVVLQNGDKKPLTVPDSGIIDITGKIKLDSCTTGDMILDFDAHISTFTHPGLHDYILSANAKIKTSETKNACGGGAGGGGTAGGGGSAGGGGAVTQTCTQTSDCNPNGSVGMVCRLNQCATDPCLGVSCNQGEVCADHNCVSVTNTVCDTPGFSCPLNATGGQTSCEIVTGAAVCGE